MYATKWLFLAALFALDFIKSGGRITRRQTGKSLSGVRNVFVNIGETAKITWSEFGENLRNYKCDDVKGIGIFAHAPQNNRDFEKIYMRSYSGSGEKTSEHSYGTKFKDHFKDRGDIVFNSSLSFTLKKAVYGDQNLYCPKARCSVVNDFMKCSKNAINLIVVDPVKHVNHTASGSTTINLGNRVHAKCVADGNPPPGMKIINMNTGEVIKQGRGGKLSYSFRAKERESKLTFLCLAENNPDMDAVTKLLKFDVKDGSATPRVTIATVNGVAQQQGVQNAFVNIGETITMSWKNFEENTVNRNCKVIRDIMILSLEPPKNKKFKPIYRLPRPRSGVDSSYISKTPFGDQFKGRGKIVYNSSMSFTLSGVRPSDQNLYCPKAKCRGPIEVVDCSHEAINLIVVADPVKQVNHTASGSTTINPGDRVQAKCVADGNPPPDMKIINMNTGEVIKQGRGGELGYSFRAKERESKLTFLCLAENNPDMGAVTKLLKFDVKGTTDHAVPNMGRGMVTKNFTGPGKYFFTVVNGASQVPPAYEGIVVLKQHKKGGSSPRGGTSGGKTLITVSVTLKIRP